MMLPVLRAIAVVATFAVSATAQADERDSVTLNNGKVRRGRVVLELDSHVLLRVGTREKKIARKDIAKIDSLAIRHTDLLRRYRQLSRTTAPKMIEFAKDASSAGLEHEARLFYWRAVLLDANHDAAHEALGHTKRGDEWRIRCGSKRLTLEKAREYHSEWNNAWEMRSEHFTVRCSAGLERTINTLFELEYAYRYFLDTFQRDLELRELLETIQVHVYRDRKKFPAAATNVGAYYSPDSNILYTYMVGRSRPVALFHEATHAMLANLTDRAAKGKGALPPWLDEGWADFMEAVIVPEGEGRAGLQPTRRRDDRIRALRSGEKPYSLQRLMNFKYTDYGASSRQAMKYAQSYALFTYMYEHAEYRETFLEFLREALAGKGQASTFNKLFRSERDTIEKAHLELR